MATVDAQKVRVAMVGAGWMATANHYPSLASLDDVEFAGICELNPARLEATADRYGIDKRYTDYRRMIEETAPDAVFVIGQPNFMYPIWTWCLEQGLNLYIEKPMGTSLHQARNLAWLAEQHDCITQVSFQRRSCPLVVKLRDECLAHGPITQAAFEFYKHGPRPFTGFVDHRLDDAVHAIDTVRFMCGGEVVGVESSSRRVQTPDINLIAATLHFDNGSIGQVMCNWASGRRILRVQMHAPGIAVEGEPEGKGYIYRDNDGKGVELDTRTVAGSEELYVYGGVQAKHREFIDAIKGGAAPGSSFADALGTMEVAEQILAQSVQSPDV